MNVEFPCVEETTARSERRLPVAPEVACGYLA